MIARPHIPGWLAGVALTLTPACALFDGLSGGDDVDGPGASDASLPPPDDDGGRPDICLDSTFIGFIDGGSELSIGPLFPCDQSVPPRLDFSNLCADGAGPGMVLTLDVLTASDFEVCLMSGEPQTFSVASEPCTGEVAGTCSEANVGLDCVATKLEEGPATIFWEPLSDVCAVLTVSISPLAMPVSP